MIEGIILAAGFSSRAGCYKMTWQVSGKSILDYCITSMLSCCAKVYVIGGFESERLKPVVAGYRNAELIYNPNYSRGMFFSVTAGLQHFNGDRVFITPGDCPLISPEVYTAMLSINMPVVIPTYHGIPGHPVLMDKNVAGMLLKNDSYSTLRDFLKDRDCTFIEVGEEGILIDADTPDDLARISEMLAKQAFRSIGGM